MRLTEKRRKLGIQFLFWAGFAIALHGSVEQAIFFANTHGGSALWSSWFGPPFIHHYLIGFILIALGWIIFSFLKNNDSITNKK